MQKARIDEKNWVRCGKCSHKFMRIAEISDSGYGSMPVIEIKCHSCKEINVWKYDVNDLIKNN